MAVPRILIVDDEPAILSAMQYALADKDWHVEVAPTAQAGFEKNRFDVVVTDKNLPDFDGIKLLAQLRSRDARTQFIVITGYASTKSAVDAANLGAVDYLTKPFEDIYAVADVIEAAILRSRKSPGDELTRFFSRMAAIARGQEPAADTLAAPAPGGRRPVVVAYAPAGTIWLTKIVDKAGATLLPSSTSSAFQEALTLSKPKTIILVGSTGSLPLARIARTLGQRARIIVVFAEADVALVRSFILAGVNAMVSEAMGTQEAEARLLALLA